MRLVSVIVFRRLAICSALVVFLSACAGTATSDSTTPPGTMVPPAVGGTITWADCPTTDGDGLKCSRLKVPFDYAEPTKGSFSLKLVKRPATFRTKRIGSLLVNPGGPGFGGTTIAENANGYLSSDLTDVFDVIGWDPRGTGDSTPAIDCIDNYDMYFATDPTPETDAQREDLVNSTKDFSAACEKESGEILPYVSTNSTARDMDTIRAALGEDKITYFGFSYGSELGATWATMFPTTVRAAVLDGAADPTSSYMEGGLQQAKGFEDELTKYLADCSADKLCAFHNGGKAEEAFDALMTSLDRKPLLVTKKRTVVNLSVALTGVTNAMYSSSLWQSLGTALNNAQSGDGSGLLRLYDDYYQRDFDGTWGNELEAFNAILCLDDPGPKTIEETDSWTPKFQAVAPRLWTSFTNGYGCVFWPAKPDPRIRITGIGAGPLVVVGTTGDAATPLASSRKMATELDDGRLIVVDADRHTGYGHNDCVVSAVDNYLITTEVDFSEKAC